MTLQTANVQYIAANDGGEYTTFSGITTKAVKTNANTYNVIFNEPQSNGYTVFAGNTAKVAHTVTGVFSISYNPPVITWG